MCLQVQVVEDCRRIAQLQARIKELEDEVPDFLGVMFGVMFGVIFGVIFGVNVQ